MMNGKKPQEEPNFSFGTRELREAQKQREAQTQMVEAAAPASDAAAPNPRDAGGGFDPYNSSGGFDRRKNWARVGKR
jgi:hypothetical protein